MELEQHQEQCRKAHCCHKHVKFIVKAAMQAATIVVAICAVNELGKIRRRM